MTNIKTNGSSFSAATRLAPRSMAAAIALALAAPAMAIDFQDPDGEWSGSIDTTISYGASWRATDYDPADVGKSANNPAAFMLPAAQQAATVGRWSNNDDDGDLNYRDAGDVITNVAKITAEADFRWRNYGAFIRASGFYDFENADQDFLNDEAEERVGKDVRLLDAYIWGEHQVGDHFLNWRLGQQVVSWGESTFIQGGLNVINPVDVSKLRLAGSELKEAFEGVNMLWGSMDLTDTVSLEALYMFEWEPIIPDPAGTYWSSSDIATPGATYAMLGFGLYPQPVINQDLFNSVCLRGNLGASDTGLPASLVGAGCALAVPRSETQQASDSGQFGAALRWYAENLNSTEFAFYYLRYHSRLPLISGYALTEVPPPFTSASYFTEYPEDIDLFGVSFNTNVGTWSLAGEVSYRPEAPLQIDDVEILFGALTPLNPLIPAEVNRYKSQLGNFAPGELIQGYHEHSSWQAQATLTKLFGPGNFLQADQVAFVTEAGLNYVDDLHDYSTLRYNGSGTDTGGGADASTGDFNNPVTEPDGFADDFSWGYRMLARASYFNAIGAWTVAPRLAWSHDVDGTTPGPGGSFIDGRKQVTAAVSFSYLDRWVVDVAYTDYLGGGKYNLLRNRDFIAASVSYSF
ncbi:DUF1302 domain-containing protein [Marinihelvus fidelis]|uniref:DUF1302 domain-containing protein n=1 Tax=Marinihelvus fidelis TaxID=2613842 RepID=A0A5N0T9F9_9GAMM|nr:DUF1302 domain-containing protein [Marinihelvus fidelis]KAA9130436.1 DUF1302 domain-containing protein [Marinihelvus fidelis]